MDLELKHRHEQFIHGNHGSYGPWEIFLLIILIQLSHILYESFAFAFPILRLTSVDFQGTKSNTRTILGIFRILFDFLLVYSPFILAMTILNHRIPLILSTILAVIFFNFFIYIRKYSKIIHLKNISRILIQYPNNKRFPHISNMMSSLLLATCLAIFAVDFSAFDRRFSKTEMYGWSLMDVGVGGFIAINGALSPESRLSGFPIKVQLRKSLRSALLLFILGLLRLFVVKSVNYHEHISEYGVHWNFFFTICFAKIFSSILCAFFCGKINLYFVSIVIMIFHQIMLKSYWTEFILDPSNRSLSFFASNKEGLISLIGFISIYLFFVQIGQNYMPQRKTLCELFSAIFHIILVGLQSLIVMFASHNLVEPVSRREANLGFICFMITCSSISISLELTYFAWLQIIRPDFHHESLVFSLINRKGLLIFLVANLVTGGINLSIDTIMVEDYLAIIMIYLYGAFLTFMGFVLDRILA